MICKLTSWVGGTDAGHVPAGARGMYRLTEEQADVRPSYSDAFGGLGKRARGARHRVGGSDRTSTRHRNRTSTRYRASHRTLRGGNQAGQSPVDNRFTLKALGFLDCLEQFQ
jgi:hypothetical protein